MSVPYFYTDLVFYLIFNKKFGTRYYAQNRSKMIC